MGGVPDDFDRDRLVPVAEDVTDPGGLPPRDGRVALLRGVRQPPTRPGDDLQPAFHDPALPAACLEPLERRVLKLGLD